MSKTKVITPAEEQVEEQGPVMLQAPECPRRAARDLERELKFIDGRIHEFENEMSRQTDESVVHAMLGKRDALLRRKEALPFLIRGARVRYLEKEAAKFTVSRDEVQGEYDKLQADLDEATRVFDEAARTLESASANIKKLEHERNDAQNRLSYFMRQVADAQIDAQRVASGQECTVPGRWDEPE